MLLHGGQGRPGASGTGDSRLSKKGWLSFYGDSMASARQGTAAAEGTQDAGRGVVACEEHPGPAVPLLRQHIKNFHQKDAFSIRNLRVPSLPKG